jgi:hypothetical protein
MDFKREDALAMNTIKDACAKAVLEGVTWYNVDDIKWTNSVAWEVKYLRTRGLLCHHPVASNLVRLNEKTV